MAHRNRNYARYLRRELGVQYTHGLQLVNKHLDQAQQLCQQKGGEVREWLVKLAYEDAETEFRQ